MKKNLLMLVSFASLVILLSFTLRTGTDADEYVRRGQDVTRTPASIGEVEFPHLEHSEDFDVECHECHHEVNATALDIPHESYFEDFWIDCETCHIKDARPNGEAMSCSECHHDRPNRISDETLSAKVAIHKNCWDCHEVGTGRGASEECTLCHSGPKKPFEPLDSAQ